MMRDLDFGYAQARIQARYAALPTEQDWQRLAASRSLPSFLEDARTGSLAPWVRALSSTSDVHDLERGIRLVFRETVEAVADWVPRRWGESVRWVRWLMLLPLLEFLKAGGAVPHWAARDPVFRDLVGKEMRTLGAPAGEARAEKADNDRDGEARGEDSPGQRLLASQEPLSSVWLKEWRRLWPGCSRRDSRGLEALSGLLGAHLEEFARSSTDSAWSLRRGLRRRLRLELRRHTLRPAAPFVFLALVALDLERLRAALVSRSLFSTGFFPGEQADSLGVPENLAA